MSTAQVDRDRTAQTGDQVDHPTESLFTAQVGDGRANLSTAQVEPLTELSETHWAIAKRCDVPLRLTEIMADLGVANRGHFKKHYLDPLIRTGIVAMMKPEKPQASDQRYVVTNAGAALEARRAHGN